MVTNTAPEKAEPGQQNAMDWLAMNIVGCLVKPMDDEVAKKLAVYSSAYEAIQKRAKGIEGKRIDSNAERDGQSGHISREMAEAWVSEMKNADGSTGGHWTLEKTKIIQAERNIEADPAAFYAAMNATYSDLSPFFKKYGISNLDAYVDYVKAFWLNDEDAVSDKLTAYYENVVEK